MPFRIVTEPVGPVTANCHILEFGEQIILIDPGGDPAILLRRIGTRTLSAMLITHGHYDHIGALGALKKRHPQAAVMIHRTEAPFLADPDLNLSGHFGIDGRYEQPPERLLDHGDRIALPDGGALTVIHTPGHTPGGVCFHGDGVLFSGDTLFFESVGRCDLPGGDDKTLLASIRERLFTLPDDTRVLPGHMNATTIGHEKRHNPFLDGDI
ncbi:MAG TPA: MBL fold metallo-hydrolase [bacterium]|nr:MBL fold metallo-hydrolase [bacterium]